jgi:DNA-binding CsgD family transcriptional regulator
MRIALVGAPRDRARIRSRLGVSMEVVGEFATVREARAAGGIDAILIASPRHGTRQGRSTVGPRSGGISEGAPISAGRDEEAIDEPLTPREIQVLELLAEGLPNKAIAGRLGISDQTVKFHVASLSGKLGATNRTDAVRRAVRRGLIAL